MDSTFWTKFFDFGVYTEQNTVNLNFMTTTFLNYWRLSGNLSRSIKDFPETLWELFKLSVSFPDFFGNFAGTHVRLPSKPAHELSKGRNLHMRNVYNIVS